MKGGLAYNTLSTSSNAVNFDMEFALSQNESLTSVSLPVAETIESRVFSGCTALTTLEIGGVTQMTSVAYTELFLGVPVLSNIHLTLGAGEAAHYETTLGLGGYRRGYGSFASVSQR